MTEFEKNSFAKEVLPITLEDEMKQSYLDYAMSVIVGRALPDVRDGLKPVHRRVLYAMKELGNDYNKSYKKSARIVGDVIGKYHPHGDTAVYDTMVRMAQPFSMRHMLIDGQGNFGSVDGDSPAAMRYTEVRMAKIAHEMLADIEKNTVDFVPNYDESEHEPAVLPTRVPNLLVNGSSGIAVGMATNIPPHNLKEVVDACIALIENPDLSIMELMQFLPGPDFPTAGFINGAKGIYDAYHTGKGRIYLRAKTHIEDTKKADKQAIIITELPFQVNKARLIEKIAVLVKDKKIEGITELRDESDKDGMRVVIELRRGEVADVVLNNLYKQTPLQHVFGINMVGLVDGQPRLLNLKDVLQVFLRHRREVVTRRTIFDLAKARKRAHILEGLAIALNNIDPVIALIKSASTPAEAKAKLVAQSWAPDLVSEMLERAGDVITRPDEIGEGFGLVDGEYRLTEMQAQAILDLRLHRLTGLEKDKIVNEYREILEVIKDLLDILSSRERLSEVIRQELVAVSEEYADPRRTVILTNHLDLSITDLITEEDVVVTLSHSGYAKAQPVSDYQAQRRGGRGKSATKTKDEDYVDKLFIASTHDSLLCFASTGKVYTLKVYELPIASRNARGKPIVNLLPLEKGETIDAVLSIRDFDDDHFVFMATSNGTVKKTALTAFARPRTTGLKAIELRDDNTLIDVAVTNGSQDIMLFASSGKAIRFPEDKVRPMGRTAAGVRGIRLKANQKVISLIVVEEEGHILLACENGYGKRTKHTDFMAKNRGGQGMIAIKATERNGDLVGAIQVKEADGCMIITANGTLIRTKVAGISVVGRNTQGVRLIRVDKGDALVGLVKIEAAEIEDEEVVTLETSDDSEE
ncbi:MAG: DNA gyrase subunit A [Gammaproteobacteria bacterium]|nr:DNA gyrase subunit A [Gammaproteobacteria bacterium]